jgi:hypothetical protein
LSPGLVGPGLTACSWTPDETCTGPEFVWAALDCPGGWTSDLAARPLVLGRMTATVEQVPPVGQPVVVVGELFASEGRKTMTGTTAYDRDGRVIGRSEQVWIEVDPTVFNA